MQMSMQSGKDDVKWAEVKQFYQWSFGRQLQYSRKKLSEGLAGDIQQKEKQDPLQDMRKDPWRRAMKREGSKGGMLGTPHSGQIE